MYFEQLREYSVIYCSNLPYKISVKIFKGKFQEKKCTKLKTGNRKLHDDNDDGGGGDHDDDDYDDDNNNNNNNNNK